MIFSPLPNLVVNKDQFSIGEKIILVDKTNYPLAEMVIEELYEPDIDFECKNAYGTLDTNHPYVLYKQEHKNKLYASGPLKKINSIRHYDFKDIRITPEESKNILERMDGIQ